MYVCIHKYNGNKLTNGFPCVDVKGESGNISTYSFKVSFKTETKAGTLNNLRHIQINFTP